MRTGRSWRRTVAAAGAAVLACVITAACDGSSSAPSSPATASRPAASASGGASVAAGSAAPGAGATASAAACVTQVLGRLTLAQQVGQLFLVGVSGDAASPSLARAVDQYHFGSLLLNKSAAGTAALARQTSAMQQLASAGTGGVRFFIAANQEGGEIQQLSGPGFVTMPSEVEQGTWTSAELRRAASAWGTDLRAAGVNLDLAPVMDVVPAGTAAGNAPIGALMRDYGASPQSAGQHGTAFIQGMAEAGVATVAKHFPGLGRVKGNTDFTANVTDNVTTADDPSLGSFRAAVGAGVPMMMVALATYTKIDATRLAAFSPVVMRLLRSGLGFSGVIVSDDLSEASAVLQVPAGTRAVDFLEAGGDLVTSQLAGPAELMAAAVAARATASPAFRATVDAAVRQVLAAKQAAGLLSC